jgi:putative mycofactocin binding protein MftB
MTTTAPAHAVGPRAATVFDASRAYALHPKVALRPERFGALAYSYATRRLSLLKDPDLVAVVRVMGEHASAAAALAAVVPAGKRPAVERAVARLVETEFLVEHH